MSQVISPRSAAAGRRATIRKWMKYFPLKTTDSVVKLFEAQILGRGPDLSLLSLVLGALEVRLATDASTGGDDATFPQLSFNEIESLHHRFLTLLRQNIPADDVASCRHGGAVVSTREIVQKVSNVVWSYLSGSYHKDRAHMQSLYSLLTGWLLILGRYSLRFEFCTCNL